MSIIYDKMFDIIYSSVLQKNTAHLKRRMLLFYFICVIAFVWLLVFHLSVSNCRELVCGL